MKDFIDCARQRQRHIVFAEGAEPRILQAARQLVDEQIASVTLIGNSEEIAEVAANHSISLGGLDLADPVTSDKLSTYAELYLGERSNAKPGMALRLLRKPLYFASMMVRAGDADLLIAGIANPTRRVIEAASLCIGFAPAISVPSSCFLMQIPGFSRPLVFADCAINIDPDAQQLAQIAVASANSAHQLLGEPPRVALLSFSTHGSADHDKVSRVREAVEIARELAPDIHFDGDLQADTALSSTVANQKIRQKSDVAGLANVLVFPDLNAGNIGYKLVQQLTSATAIGPLLQGFAKPVADLSRGASIEEIVLTSAVAVIVADANSKENANV